MEIILMLAGAGIIYILIEKIYIKYWLKGLTADIKFTSEFAFPGDTVNLLEVVTNQKWLPLHFINVKFQLDKNLEFFTMDANSKITDRSYKNDVFSLLFYQRVTRTIPLMCKKRGYYTIDKIELISSGIFMNDILAITIPISSNLVIYPASVNVDIIQVPYRRIMGSIITNQFTYEDPFEFKGIREYQTYDPLDKVNWNATAKTDQLKVNMFDNTISNEVCILLNLENEGMITYETLLEESISIASSLAQLLIESGVPTSIISNGKDIISDDNLIMHSGSGLSHIDSINQGLARVDLKKTMDDFTRLLEDELHKNTSKPLYILISSNKSVNIQVQFQEISLKSKESIWILPFHENLDWEPKECKSDDIISWEVPYHE